MNNSSKKFTSTYDEDKKILKISDNEFFFIEYKITENGEFVEHNRSSFNLPINFTFGNTKEKKEKRMIGDKGFYSLN